MAIAHVATTPPPVLRLLAHPLRWEIFAALAHSDRRVSELVDALGKPINLVSYHLKRLRQQHLVVERHSSAGDCWRGKLMTATPPRRRTRGSRLRC